MSERALFVTQAKAATAAERLRFIHRDANFKPHYNRGQLLGYSVAYEDAEGWHILCENEINKFGLD